MPLFEITEGTKVKQILSGAFEKERTLQRLVEANLPQIFGVEFIASEFVIRGEQPGRIDTLGLDQGGTPTIIEYKRSENENVINQGLYYMNWLVDHRGDFVVAAREQLGNDVEINWNYPRLIIIAQSYAKWDTYAVKRMGDGIELWKYVLYGDNLLYLEQVYGQQRSTPSVIIEETSTSEENPAPEPTYTLEYHINYGQPTIQELFRALREGILNLAGDEGEIIETPNKLYVAYRHGRNFCEVQVHRQALKLYLDIPFGQLHDPKEIARDVYNVGHWGTGNVEVKISRLDDLEDVMALIAQSYRMTL